MDAPPRGRIGVGVPDPSRTVVDARSGGVVCEHRRSRGTVIDTFPCLVGSIVVGLGRALSHTLISSVVSKRLELSYRTNFNAQPSVIVGIAVVGAEDDASLSDVLAIVSRDRGTLQQAKP